MARRYTYARTISTVEGIETFTAHEWDSFDEARTAVEKGIRDRKIQLGSGGLTRVAPSIPPGQVMQPGEPSLNAVKGPFVPSGNNTTGGTQ